MCNVFLYILSGFFGHVCLGFKPSAGLIPVVQRKNHTTKYFSLQFGRGSEEGWGGDYMANLWKDINENNWISLVVFPNFQIFGPINMTMVYTFFLLCSYCWSWGLQWCSGTPPASDLKVLGKTMWTTTVASHNEGTSWKSLIFFVLFVDVFLVGSVKQLRSAKNILRKEVLSINIAVVLLENTPVTAAKLQLLCRPAGIIPKRLVNNIDMDYRLTISSQVGQVTDDDITSWRYYNFQAPGSGWVTTFWFFYMCVKDLTAVQDLHYI